MTARDRLLEMLHPDVVSAIEELIEAEVARRLQREPERVTVAEAARRLRISYRAMDGRIRRGTVKAVIEDGRRMVEVSG